MDLMEMSDHDLYFDQPLPQSMEALIRQAALHYHQPEAEFMLLAAYMILPHHPTIHVALYRYYYYKHRLPEALLIAERTLEDAGINLGFLGHWSEATLARLKACDSNMAMVRYYLLALKGSGFICLRIGRRQEGLMRLQKVVSMDSEDRLGAAAILRVVEDYREED
ncbi:hypothetical protein [Mariprofundus ferrooxydans]|uniref:hypothetical protein n=1 Tax=Mariprofundus ferrooxydans TaxID=314344 RepID=UPI0003622709|nr:hypothetical protein [Mariprofundus ferrooxydans]